MMEVPHKDKFKTLSKVMKRYTSLLFITVTLIGLSCSHKSIDSEKASLPLNFEAMKCYNFSNDNDTIFLTMEYKGDSVVGNLVYRLFQKDSNSGVINGKMEKDLLVADYTFQSEGIQSIRQVVFKRVGDNFVEGYGEIENKNEGIYFRNIDSLKFNYSIVLKLVHCQSAK